MFDLVIFLYIFFSKDVFPHLWILKKNVNFNIFQTLSIKCISVSAINT